MKTARISLPRLDFAAKIFLWASLCVLTLFIAAGFAWVQVGQQGLPATQHDMDVSLKGFEMRLDERSVDMEDLGKWLTAQSEFVDLLAPGKSADLTAYLDRLVKAGIADTVTAADSEGRVLARVSRDQPDAAGESIMADPGIREGLAGQISRGIRRDEFNNVVQSLVFPVSGGEQRPPIGVLRMGVYLDGGFLSRVSGTANTQLSYYFAEGDTLFQFGDSQRKPLLTKPIPPAALASWQQGQSSNFITLDTVKGPYLFKFTPFRSLDHTFVAAYGVGLPLDAVPGGRSGLLVVMEITILTLAAFTCIGAYRVYRRYAVPLRRMDQAAQRVAAGDGSVRELLRDGELDGLGGHLNKMYERMRESVASNARERNREAAIVESLGAPVVVTDADNHIVELNPAAELLLDGCIDKPVGRDWREIFQESKRPNEGDGLFREGEGNGSSHGFASSLQGRYSLRRDPRVILDVVSKPLELDGRAAGYVHVLDDAREQEYFARARDEFMMNVAHELRSPLASLRTAIETLHEEQLLLSKHELNMMIQGMRRSVTRFEAFVENLIDMGSVMAGRFVVRPMPCVLDEIMDTAISQVRPLLEAKGQSVKLESNCSQPCKVFADSARITQVIVNLLTNASKYGPEKEPIVLWVCDSERFVNLDVSDRGKGIPPEEQAKLFQRFYRGKRGAVEGTGLGLGLALTKEIVEAHGGQIGIKSQVGEGTTFWFSLLKAA